MAKKTKRKVSSGMRPVVTAGSEMLEAAPSTNGSATPISRRTTSYSTEFNPDYSYVVKDLKRIGMLAGTFLAILIILSFIIN